MSPRDWEMWKKEEIALEKQAWRNQHRRLVQLGEWPLTVELRCLPQVFFKIKNEEKKSFADWQIELANRGFGMSTDAFLKSVKKFLDKEVWIIPFNSGSRSSPYSFVMFYFTMLQLKVIFLESIARLLCKCREVYKSLAVEIYVQLRCSCSVRILDQLSGYWAT